MGEQSGQLPFWLVNVPENKRPSKCPDYLENLDQRNKDIIGTPDASYHVQTWPEVAEQIKTNKLDLFQRLPSDQRRYKGYMAKLKEDHGDVMTFIMKERVKWDDIEPSGPPFVHAEDLKILYNDWPYGIDPKIVHLVVWTKFALVNDEKTGDLTDSARQEIDEYVGKTFRSRVPAEHVAWFKNFARLKSVKALEHFHVMMYDPDADFVKEVTDGDSSMSSTVGGDFGYVMAP